MQEMKSDDIKFLSTNAFKDLIVIAVILVSIFILSHYFNIFIVLVELFQKNPKSITFIDEIITGLLTISICSAIFSWRRWKELKKEISERIKLHEEIVRMANTKAEAERIISKQLRSEIEHRKNIEEKIAKLTHPHSKK